VGVSKFKVPKMVLQQFHVEQVLQGTLNFPRPVGCQKKIKKYLCLGVGITKKSVIFVKVLNDTTMTHNEILSLGMGKGEREFDPRETLSVLQYNRNIFWSWGVSKMVNLQNKGLMFKVNGHHHKGWVLVTLGWEDLYKVYIVSNTGKFLDEYTGIFFDDLVEVIDNRIEKIPDYKY